MRPRWVVYAGLILAVPGTLFWMTSEDSTPDYTVQGDGIQTPLSAFLGDPIRGERIFKEREKGHCILCHQISAMDAAFQGDVGPSLDGIGSRLTAAQLRLRIVDYDAVKPGTTMPSYYRVRDLKQVAPAYQGQTVLSAQDIEDVIRYLSLQTDSPLQKDRHEP